MKRKIVWLVVSGLMVLSLLAAACAPKVEEKAPAAPAPVVPVAPTAPVVPVVPAASAKEMVKLTLTKLDGTKMEKLVEKPRYGGTLRFFITEPFRGFEPFQLAYSLVTAGRLTMDTLAAGDWTRSSVGTGETNFLASLYYPAAFYVGALAESWEVPNANTIIYRLRKGIKFQDKPPTGTWSGREMTSDDVAFSIKTAYATRGNSAYNALPLEFHPVSVEAPDKYTVVVKSAPGFHIAETHRILSIAAYIVPRDFYEKYKNMLDWRNAMGTGPFLMVDYIPASVAIFNRNPNYWKKDPFFPENQLPYVDRFEWFIIPDKSTYVAALRTGKVDRGDLTAYEDLQGLLKTKPDIPWIRKQNPTIYLLKLVVDNPKLPQYDVRVRRALSMAIDRDTIIKNFFDGYADKLAYPVPNTPDFIAIGLYVPLEQQSPLAQEILSYNPEKAKQLLAEAGYPKGFKTSVDVITRHVDYMSVIREYFAAISVDMEIRVRDPGVWESMAAAKSFEHMDFGGPTGTATPYAFLDSRTGLRVNRGKVSDPYIDALAVEVANLVYDEAAQRKLYQEKAYAYLLEQVWNIVVPNPHLFFVRQPWLRNNDDGETNVGTYQGNSFPQYVWLDQELKKAMGY